MTAPFSSSLPAEQALVVERLRELILLEIPNCYERLAFGVPHFYINSRVCFMWPTAVPGSGVAENGVLLGFWKGHLIKHRQDHFRGQANKVVRFAIYEALDQIKESDISSWLEEARALDWMKEFR